MAQNEKRTLGEKLLSIRREWLFAILIVGVSIPQFFSVPLPNLPKPESKDLFDALNTLPEGATVLIQSDWTESTRGENRGHFDALLRILMRRKAKFALLSVADTQAPQVARDVVFDLNEERRAAGLEPYKKWDDWIELGYFPNAEGLGQAMRANIRDAFGSRRDKAPGGIEQPVFQSPVLQNINKVEDLELFMVVTGTKSIVIAIERLSDKAKMAGMVTGVMGPETLNYYISGQLKGLAVGLKGVYDMETQMEETYPGQKNLDKGAKYIFTLHIGIGLLILAVVVGNLGVFMTRKRGAA